MMKKAGSCRKWGMTGSLLRWQDGAYLEAAVLLLVSNYMLREVYHWAEQVNPQERAAPVGRAPVRGRRNLRQLRAVVSVLSARVPGRHQPV